MKKMRPRHCRVTGKPAKPQKKRSSERQRGKRRSDHTDASQKDKAGAKAGIKRGLSPGGAPTAKKPPCRDYHTKKQQRGKRPKETRCKALVMKKLEDRAARKSAKLQTNRPYKRAARRPEKRQRGRRKSEYAEVPPKKRRRS